MIRVAGLLVVSFEPLKLPDHGLASRPESILFRARIGARQESLGKIRLRKFFLAGVL